MQIKTRFILDVFLTGGQTVRFEAEEYSFTTQNGKFTGYKFKGLRSSPSFDPEHIIGYHRVGKTYRLF
jgi:hypothetical protein